MGRQRIPLAKKLLLFSPSWESLDMFIMRIGMCGLAGPRSSLALISEPTKSKVSMMLGFNIHACC